MRRRPACPVTAYLVFTAYTTVKPLRTVGRLIDIALLVLAFRLAAFSYVAAFSALGRPGNQMDGVPAGMMFFMTTVLLLAAIGDARMIRAGGLHGPRSVARHLWRMCFGVFTASGSFLLGQMKFAPEPIRILPMLFVVAVSSLAFLLCSMWRVRLKQILRGLMTAKTVDARGAA